MKEEIHPDVKEVTITCACGEEYKTKSTVENVRVEVCGKCHPFYTGKTRTSAKGGRVERFKEKYGFTGEEEVSTSEVAEETETEEKEEEVTAEE